MNSGTGHFLRFLVDHHGHADAAVRIWHPPGQLAPIVFGSMDEIGPIAERAHERDWEPVAHRLPEARLLLHVVRQVRQRVALCLPALVGDFFVAARERHRLKREEADSLRVVQRELNDPADLLVVDAVDDRRHRHDLDARFPRFSIARSLTSNRLPTRRCAFAALPMPSNCRYA